MIPVEQLDQAREILRKLQADRSSRRGDTVVRALRQQMFISETVAAELLDSLRDKGEISYSGYPLPTGMVDLKFAMPVAIEPESLVRWKSATQSVGIPATEVGALEPCHEKLKDWADADLMALARGLLALRAAQAQETGKPRFVVSAKYLLASSKLIGNLPAAALKAFGIDIDLFPDSIPQIVVAGPADPEAVLLIENPHSFEEAVAAGCAEKIALIVTFGYGLSRSGEAYGNCLVETIAAAERLVPLVRVGCPPSPATLFQHSRVHFWGDLDREGLRIYARLRDRIPLLRLSALYAPMVTLARRGDSHPYSKGTAKENQSPLGAVPEDAFPLIPWCGERGVDQEVVSAEDICRFADRPFFEIDLEESGG